MKTKVNLEIDELDEGLIFNMSFFPLMDENYFSNSTHPDFEERKELIKQQENLKVTFPAIITKINKNKHIVTADVAFWQRTNSLEVIPGYLLLKKVAIWRYFDKKGEMIPPNWLLVLIYNSAFNFYKNKADLFEISNKSLDNTENHNCKKQTKELLYNIKRYKKFCSVDYSKLYYIVKDGDNYYKYYLFDNL